jgi:hypothetical protein
LSADLALSLGEAVNNPLFKKLPGIGAGTTALETAMKRQAAEIITGKAEKGLGEFAGLLDEIDAPPVYFGPFMGGLVGGRMTGETLQGDRK